METVTWLTHPMSVYNPVGTTWNDKAGVYIFAGKNPQGLWRAFYVGVADSFSSRFADHERWLEAALLGATHVHAMVVPLVANRAAIEQELIRAYQPPLNTHHR